MPPFFFVILILILFYSYFFSLLTDRSVVTMGKRGERFNPLPTSDESDPALLSHRSIDMNAAGRNRQGEANNGKLAVPTSRRGKEDDEESQIEQRYPTPNDESDAITAISPLNPAQRTERTDEKVNEAEEENDDDEDEEELLCGLGRCFSPAWLQPFASKQMFLAVFCLACVLQGMFFT